MISAFAGRPSTRISYWFFNAVVSHTVWLPPSQLKSTHASSSVSSAIFQTIVAVSRWFDCTKGFLKKGPPSSSSSADSGTVQATPVVRSSQPPAHWNSSGSSGVSTSLMSCSGVSASSLSSVETSKSSASSAGVSKSSSPSTDVSRSSAGVSNSPMVSVTVSGVLLPDPQATIQVAIKMLRLNEITDLLVIFRFNSQAKPDNTLP
ncbi:MAG: hypothetical protein BWX66_02133 [Deltaproteobacteria bacterium ADurb.Bin058]|nr:MAG: hypothetical protein BWX66_02133 [Deltaproteobacteria bacterium ADurb.Bin058]